MVRLDQRARSQREIIQAGVEMAGVAGPRGDAEIVALAAAALEAVGFAEVTIDLGHLGLAREVLDALGLPEDARAEVRNRIAKRDRAGLAELLKGARGPRSVVEFAALLPELSGPPELLSRAIARAPSRPAGIRRALQQLAELLAELRRHPVPARLHVDLSEVRGFDYYTGMRVQGYVHGAAEAVLQGGRYDDLLARYGRSSPAVGFAIDVEATAGALEQLAEQRTPRTPGSRSSNGLGQLPAMSARTGSDTAPPATAVCWSAGPWTTPWRRPRPCAGTGAGRRWNMPAWAARRCWPMPGAGTSTK